jgi:hypothetical protein
LDGMTSDGTCRAYTILPQDRRAASLGSGQSDSPGDPTFARSPGSAPLRGLRSEKAPKRQAGCSRPRWRGELGLLLNIGERSAQPDHRGCRKRIGRRGAELVGGDHRNRRRGEGGLLENGMEEVIGSIPIRSTATPSRCSSPFAAGKGTRRFRPSWLRATGSRWSGKGSCR